MNRESAAPASRPARSSSARRRLGTLTRLGVGLRVRVTREVLWVWAALAAAFLLAGLERLPGL